jgi:hypothetical protein
MSPVSFRPIAAAAVAAVLAAAAGAQAVAAGTATSSVSVSGIRALTQGKLLASGRVNVVPVHSPFGFAVAVRNDAHARRDVVVEVRVRYDRRDQAPFVLKTTRSLAPGEATVRLTGRPLVAFAQRARLTVSVSDHSHRTTAVRHYALIFALG